MYAAIGQTPKDMYRLLLNITVGVNNTMDDDYFSIAKVYERLLVLNRRAISVAITIFGISGSHNYGIRFHSIDRVQYYQQ